MIGTRWLTRQASRVAGREKYSVDYQHSRRSVRPIRVDWYHEFRFTAAKGLCGLLFKKPARLDRLWPEVERGTENEWGGKDYQDVMNGSRRR